MKKLILLLSLLGLPALSQTSNTRVKMEIAGVGVVNLRVVDTGGEPVGADKSISIDLVCTNSKTPKRLEKDLQTCAYDGIRYNKEKFQLELKVRYSALGASGILSCSDRQVEAYPITCP